MKFVGSYTTELKEVLIGSAVAGENAMTISPPGWGKTDMADQLSQKIAGDDGAILMELDPSTPPEAVRGAYDPAQILNGKLVRITEGTPYATGAHVVVLDEVWRTSDVIFDILIHAIARKRGDQTTNPVFWGTSNFVGKAERTAALRDRFGFWLHLSPTLDVRGIALAHLNNGAKGIDPSWGADVPSWDECVRIHRCHPTERAADAVVSLIETLAAEAEAEKMELNPRRIVQWQNILFRNSVFATGTEDFEVVPDSVSKLLGYAYPAVTSQDALKWRQIATSIVDQLGAQIEAYRTIAYEKLRAVASTSSITDKTERIGVLGQTLSEAQSELTRLGKNDPRAIKAIMELTQWFQAAVKGDPLTSIK
jgi:MoxR-like ATPase